MTSPQTLSEPDRRLLAGWAADCAERVLPLFEASTGDADRIPAALARAHAYARGESTTAAEIRLRMVAFKAASAATTPAGGAAARSVAQAAAVAHVGAHALGAAAYAVKAVSQTIPHDPDAAVAAEIGWQLAHLTTEQRAALARLPALGADTAGPLGPGLLTQGILGETIRRIQSDVGSSPVG